MTRDDPMRAEVLLWLQRTRSSQSAALAHFYPGVGGPERERVAARIRTWVKRARRARGVPARRQGPRVVLAPAVDALQLDPGELSGQLEEMLATLVAFVEPEYRELGAALQDQILTTHHAIVALALEDGDAPEPSPDPRYKNERGSDGHQPDAADIVSGHVKSYTSTTITEAS